MSKDTTIRVKTYTKERITKASKRLKISQGEVVERALLTAEKFDFSTDDYVLQVRKLVQNEINRLIGFLKVQDKNLIQVQKNLEYKISGVPQVKTPKENREQNGLQFYIYLTEKYEKIIEKLTKEIDELRTTNGRLDPAKADANYNKINSLIIERKNIDTEKAIIEDYWTDYLRED